MSFFDDEYRAKLGPRPPMRRGVYCAANREWDLAYAGLFPSGELPVYHPRRRKTKAIEKAGDDILAKADKKVRDAA